MTSEIESILDKKIESVTKNQEHALDTKEAMLVAELQKEIQDLKNKIKELENVESHVLLRTLACLLLLGTIGLFGYLVCYCITNYSADSWGWFLVSVIICWSLLTVLLALVLDRRVLRDAGDAFQKIRGGK